MTTEVVDGSASIVVLGKLNPLIFQPDWLRRHKIIGQQEAEDAEQLANSIEVIHPDLTALKLYKSRLVVESERLLLTVLEEPWDAAKDFVSSCFLLLPHTPCRAVGINFSQTIKAESEASWHAFGDMLAPKEPWSVLLPGSEEQRLGGLRTMTMELTERAGERPGYTRVTVEALESAHGHTKISVNDHFALDAGVDGDGEGVVKLIQNEWDSSMARAKEYCAAIKGLADGV